MTYRPKYPKCKGKYFLEIIDDVMYSTDSYALYSLYYRMFYPDIYYETDKIPIGEPEGQPATRQDMIIALKEEKRMYDLGYVPKLVEATDKKGRVWKRTRWVKDLKKASDIHFQIEKEFEREMRRLGALK